MMMKVANFIDPSTLVDSSSTPPMVGCIQWILKRSKWWSEKWKMFLFRYWSTLGRMRGRVTNEKSLHFTFWRLPWVWTAQPIFHSGKTKRTEWQRSDGNDKSWQYKSQLKHKSSMHFQLSLREMSNGVLNILFAYIFPATIIVSRIGEYNLNFFLYARSSCSPFTYSPSQVTSSWGGWWCMYEYE